LNASRPVIENCAVATVDPGESEYESGHAGAGELAHGKSWSANERHQATGVSNYLKPDA
jgi:hypothetical protein